MATQPVRVGARASKLAVIQAESVRAAIAAALGDDEAAVLIRFTTSGDRIQDRTLTEIGGKGLFTAEIEAALLAGEIDCAVHSLKDMPTEVAAGLAIAATPEREDPRDVFVSPRYANLADLPRGAVLGTASLRRQAQALAGRPDLTIIALRGNVDTRLAKLERGEADAIVLAAAGLNRLGLAGVARGFVDPASYPPAPGQGALAVQTRASDADAAWLARLRHRPTLLAVSAERGALAALDGSCRTAVGAFARQDRGRLLLTVQALSPDGRQSATRSESMPEPESAEAAWAFGLGVGAAVRADAAAFLAA